MENLKTFFKNQQEIYHQNNTFDINLCNPISNNISDLNIDEDLFYSMIKKYRNYKLNYSQGKFYQDLNNICLTSCNRNNDIYSYILLERENMKYNQHSILIANKKYSPIDLFTNKKDYVIEEDYEVLTVHINENLRIYFETIGETHQIRIQLSLENGIPNTYFEEYLKEIDSIIESVVS